MRDYWSLDSRSNSAWRGDELHKIYVRYGIYVKMHPDRTSWLVTIELAVLRKNNVC